MDLDTFRLDQIEKRTEAFDARLARVEDRLGEIQVTLAGLATRDRVAELEVSTRDAVRNWGLTLAAIVIATGIGVGAMVLQASGNQLSAFQAGLSAIEAVTAAHSVAPAQK